MTNYTKPPVQPAWAESGDRNDVPSNAELQEGWPQSNTPPTRQRFNWILNWLSNAIRYWMQKGIADWDAAESYQQGGIIQDDTGQTWQALRANTNAEPVDSPLDWVKWPNTTAIEADVADAVATADAAGELATTANNTANTANSTANAALPKSGGTMTGPITLSADGTGSQAVRYSQATAMIKTAYAQLTGFSNLRGYCTSGSFVGVNLSYDSCVMRNNNGDTFATGAATLSLSNSVTVGLNGSDGSASNANQFVYVYAIGGPGKTPACVWSLSDVAPNLTNAAFAGYTFYALAMPLRQGSGGTIVQVNQLGDETYYIGNRLSGTVLNGSMSGNTPLAMTGVGVFVPPRAYAWKPCGYWTGSYSVNQGGSLGACVGTLQGGRDYGNQAIVDFALVIQDSGAFTATCQDEIPNNTWPWFNGLTPWLSFSTSNGLSLVINFSVLSFRYPNGAS